MIQRSQRAAMLLFILPLLTAGKTGISRVTGMRSWSHADSTRVIIEMTGPVEYRADRATNPDRLFFDLLKSRPWIDQKPYASQTINDTLVKRVRIAETTPGTTRIVFDLTGPGTFTVSKLEAPNRLVIEIHPPASQTPAPAAVVSSGVNSGVSSGPPILDPVPLPSFNIPWLTLTTAIPKAPAPKAPISPVKLATWVDAVPRPSENASRSLTRALGLKVNRIVIDAGHGGHDRGTSGAGGVYEKDVVLDVAMRLAKLVQTRMGTDVVLTRSEDRFIPLQERTAIANAARADLFLSIHANSSPSPSVAGTETFYLNFSSTPGATEVAARENAGAEKGVGDLRDLVQKITLNDKLTESQTFAQNVQSAIFSQAAKSNSTARNRGVKRAPFVVLIGASMPSILAEIGFLTNSRDVSNLGKPEYRQKIAEALFKGLSQYSMSLSHFEVARK